MIRPPPSLELILAYQAEAADWAATARRAVDSDPARAVRCQGHAADCARIVRRYRGLEA